jgi:hypothetical protein
MYLVPSNVIPTGRCLLHALPIQRLCSWQIRNTLPQPHERIYGCCIIHLMQVQHLSEVITQLKVLCLLLSPAPDATSCAALHRTALHPSAARYPLLPINTKGAECIGVTGVNDLLLIGATGTAHWQLRLARKWLTTLLDLRI